MKYVLRIGVILSVLLLSGCNIFQTSPQIAPEVVYKTISPPSIYLVECYPNRPQTASLEDLIIIQSRALDQCNDQLELIRDWVNRQNKN